MNNLRFTSLPLSEDMQQAVRDMGFEEATAIQAQAIPLLMEGRDLIGQAQTGTGKTAAFAIPVIERIAPENRKIQAIVICPTRELALQVTAEFQKLGKYRRDLMTLAVYGGQPIMRQVKALSRRPQIVVGTPGRILDLICRGVLRLDAIRTVVLDEADEMLNMGFRKDIEKILQETPAQRQTVLFSATMSQPILELTARYQRKALHVKVARCEQPIAEIEQVYFELHRKSKKAALIQLLEHHRIGRSLVFCNTKWQVDALVKSLRQDGYDVDGLHGGMPQPKRDKIMQRFRRGGTQVLVATDVAARGLDVDNIEAVFNYDVPRESEFYIHRIGRTGRAGKSGRAFTFVESREFQQFKTIRNYSNARMSREELPVRM